MKLTYRVKAQDLMIKGYYLIVPNKGIFQIEHFCPHCFAGRVIHDDMRQQKIKFSELDIIQFQNENKAKVYRDGKYILAIMDDVAAVKCGIVGKGRKIPSFTCFLK